MKDKALTIGQIDQLLAHFEGGKSQAKIGDVRQIRKALCKMMVQDPRVLAIMVNCGLKQLPLAKRK